MLEKETLIQILNDFFSLRLSKPEDIFTFYLDGDLIKTYTNKQFISLVIRLCDLYSQKHPIVAIEAIKHPYSLAAIIACLAINKTFVALNPAYSQDYRNHIMRQLNSPCFYSFNELSRLLERNNSSGERHDDNLSLDKLIANILRYSTSTEKSIAYIVFTSGSTGLPKGVQIYRSSFALYTNFLRSNLKLFPKTLQLSLSPLFFDNFIFDLSILLYSGTPIFLVDALSFLRHQFPLSNNYSRIFSDIDFVYAAPSIIDRLLNSSFFDWIKAKIKPIFIGFGGEPFSWQSAEKLVSNLNNKSKVINFYGPSECTCMCSYFDLSIMNFLELRQKHEPSSSNLPIGQLFDYFDHTIISTDDSQSILSSSNKFGELALSGSCLMKGYLDKDVPSFAIINSILYYKTGDLVSLHNSSCLYIHGRTDNQYKILGNRIELEEIESKIKSILQQNDLFVSILNDRGIPRIILLILNVSDNDSIQEIIKHPDELSLLSLINSKLSPSMRISDVLNISSIMLSSNGKLDRSKYTKILITFFDLN